MVSFDITSLLTLNIIKDYVNNDDQFNRKTVTYMENFFHHIISLHQNFEFIIEEESKGRLAFLDTLLKRNNGYGIGMHWYVGTLRTLYNTYTTAFTTKNATRKDFSSLFNITYSIITNKTLE